MIEAALPSVETLAQALGRRGDPSAARALAADLARFVNAQLNEESDQNDAAVSDQQKLHAQFRALDSCREEPASHPVLTLARWPGDAPFALFLSHDVDQIYDREPFRILADVNHVRRVLSKGEAGRASLALRRIGRSVLRPKPAADFFQKLLGIEQRHRFRSTFYLLHDPYWSRHGPRYTFRSTALRHIVEMIRECGGEIGVHGGYYRFNNRDAYRQSREAVRESFGVEAVGIRNHYLRFSYPETWRAQEAAGFEYDATYGWRRQLGARAGLPFPFHPYDLERGRAFDLIELPLTVMDTTLFRHLRLREMDALDTAWAAVERVVEIGGLVSLLWHNNFFDEPEYADWQSTYSELLERAAQLGPWCATGAEISRWWRERARVRWQSPTVEEGFLGWTVESGAEMRDVVLKLRPAELVSNVLVEDAHAQVECRQGAWRIGISRLAQGSRIAIRAAIAA